MNKFVQALLSGIFFTFILDFFLFLGIKENYTDFYEIGVYYNILFADHQNIFIYALFSIIIGVLIVYVNNTKLSVFVLGIMFLLVTSTLIPSIGHKVGEMMLMQKDVIYKNAKYTFRGDAYYIGRDKITFYDYELKKIILLDKKELR
jgi:hypothetical protein